jgi:hypothetical protein
VLGDTSRGWYSVRTTDPADAAPDGAPSGEFSQAHGNDEIPQQMSDALAHGEDRA